MIDISDMKMLLVFIQKNYSFFSLCHFSVSHILIKYVMIRAKPILPQKL